MSSQSVPVLPMSIAGRSVAGEGPLVDVINPATGAVIAQVPDATDAQLTEAVHAAQQAFLDWRGVDVDRRRDVVRLLGKTLSTHVDELATLLTTEQGKPLALARAEITRAAMWCEVLAGLDVPWTQTDETDTHTMITRRVPLGVVAAIVPWNFPVSLAIWKVAPALLAGNTVVVKPSPFTPLTALRIGELIADVAPAGTVNVISGRDDLGPRLTSHPGIAKIAFTGSTATGKRVMESAAKSLARVTLELGGNDAAIVLPDVDLDEVVPRLFNACFANSGQYCLAAKRVYIHDDIYDSFTEKFVAFAKQSRVGNGLEDDVDMGPIQNRPQYEKVLEVIAGCRAEGLQFLLEPEVLDGPGYFIRPSVVDNPPDDATIVTEEPFGPVVPFLRYVEIDDVVRRANDSVYGLGGSVWGADVEKAVEVASRLESGVVWVNEIHRLDPAYPFGGHRESGIGAENGLDGILAYTNSTVISVLKN